MQKRLCSILAIGFYRAAWNADASSDKNYICPSVWLSVCPSVKRMDCDKTKEKCVQIFIYHTKDVHLTYFSDKKNGWWGRHFEILGNRPRWSEIADFEQMIARSASAVTRSEKSSINTNRKSPTRFPMTQDEHRTLSLNPQRVAQKRSVQNWTITCDISETVRDRMSVNTINQ